MMHLSLEISAIFPRISWNVHPTHSHTHQAVLAGLLFRPGPGHPLSWPSFAPQTPRSYQLTLLPLALSLTTNKRKLTLRFSLISHVHPPTMSCSPAPQATFCALCAFPCLPSSASSTPSWLQTHTSLRLSFGPIPPPPPPRHGQPTWTPTWNRPPPYPAYSPSAPADAHRSITLHTYCLSAALRLERSEHGKSMLQAWSPPKWTGWMEWGRPGEFSAWRVGGVSPSACEEQGGGYGRWEVSRQRGGTLDPRCWIGLRAQVERWANGQRHYLPVSVSLPLILGNKAY